MRDKVLAAIEVYSAGGTIERALETVGISKTPFRKMLRQDPEIMALYESAMAARSYVFQDDAYKVADEMGTDDGLDPANARVKAEILLKLAGAAHPDRFGNRVNVQHEVKPSLAGAIEAGKARALQPPRDLAPVIDAEYTMVSDASQAHTSDKQSANPQNVPVSADIDPFDT